jgi:hypothetical protein
VGDEKLAKLLEMSTETLMRGGLSEAEALAVINAWLVLGKAQEREEAAKR